MCALDSECTAPLKCVDTGGGVKKCRAVTVDARVFDGRTLDAGQAPDTVIGDKPPAVTNSTSATFTFMSVPSGGTFECQLNEATSFTPCNASQTFPTVPEGTNTLRVRAVLGGLADPSPATYTWRVDLTPPNTVITDPRPPATNAPTSVTLNFSTEPLETGVTFTCRLVGPGQAGTEVACTSPRNFTGLTINSSYTFTAFATDAGGNKDVDGASYSFTTGDLDPPVVTATCPATPASSNDISIPFSSNKTGSTFKCKLTGPGQNGAEGDCVSPKAYADLGDGSYVFSVTATAGGLTSTPATCSFVVNASAPVVDITAPAEGSNVGKSVTVAFTVTPPEAGLTFTCTAEQAAGNKTAECGAAGTAAFTGLAIGAVTFRVSVRDSGGNVASDAVNATVIDAPGVNITLTPFFNGFTRASGSASFVLMGAFTSVSYECTLNGTAVPGCAPGTPIPWDSLGLEHGDTVTVVVKATDTTNGQFTETTASAEVDEQGPTCSFITPEEGSVIGSFVVAIFTCDGGTTFTCTIDGESIPCAPDEPFGAVLPGGDHFVTAATEDELGNPSNPLTVNFRVDAVGPRAVVTQAPDRAACPTSTQATEIRWDLTDFTMPNLANTSNIVRANCTLDGSVTLPCLATGRSAIFRWTSLQEEGEHRVTIVAFDRFGNPGPRNPDNSLGQTVVFFVDNTPPNVEVNVDSDIDLDATAGEFRVTSGGDGVGGYGTITIIASDPDGADPGNTDPDHLPLAVRSCLISRIGGAAVPCPCTDVSDLGDGTLWSCSFANLSDANNDHTVSVVVEDACGTEDPENNSDNDAGDSETWLVDSTEDTVDFNAFSTAGGEIIVDQTPLGEPDNDIVDGTITATFAINDPVADEYDSSVTPLLLNCEVDDGNDNTPTGSAPCGGESFAISPASVPTEGLHTLSVWVSDGVGNHPFPAIAGHPTPSEWQFAFFVDRSAPTIDNVDVQNDPTGNQPEDCVTAPEGGIPVTDGAGRVAFGGTEPPAGVPDYVTYVCTLRNSAAAVITTVTCAVTPTSDQAACNCAPAHGGFDFTGLVSDEYELTISATDGVGHSTTVTADFAVDVTRPVVAFVAPPAAFEESGFAGIVPLRGAGNTGTFTVTADTSSAPYGVACTIDAATVACDLSPADGPGFDGEYDIPEALAEPPLHTAAVVVTDCVGNQNLPSSVQFNVDKNPPVVNSAVAAQVLDASTDPDDGVARVSFDIRDLITNVQTFTCSLDGNPLACDSLLDPAPPANASDPDGNPQTYVGTITFTELAAGEHEFIYTVADIWGHVTAPATILFNISHGAATGHVVLVGHDYDSVFETTATFEPPAQDDAIGSIAGNAAWLSEARDFARPLHLVRVVSATSSSAAQTNAAAQICEQLNALRPGGCDCANPTINNCIVNDSDLVVAGGGGDGAALRAALHGNDVVLLHDLNNPAVATALGSEAAWLSALGEFVTRGGIILTFDGMAGGGVPVPSQNFRVLGNPGGPQLIAVSASQEIVDNDDMNGDSVRAVQRDCVTDATDELTIDDDGTRVDVYLAPSSSVRFRTSDAQAAVLYSAYSPGSDESCAQGETSNGRCIYLPVVLDRRYSWPAGLGPIRVAAFDNGFVEPGAIMVVNNAAGAVVADPDGDFTNNNNNVCIVRNDGTGHYSGQISGQMITVLTGFARKSVLESTTVQNVQAFDSVTVGSRSFQRDLDIDSGMTVQTIPPFAGAASYAVTNGCDTLSGLAEANGQVVYNLAVNAGCLEDADNELVNVVLEARDASGTVLAYNVAENLTGGGSYIVNAGDFSGWRTASVVSLNTPGAVPNGATFDANVFFGANDGAARLVYQQRADTEDLALPFFKPQAADGFLLAYQPLGVMSFPLSVDNRRAYTVLQNDIAVPVGAGPSSVTIDRAAFLPPISEAQLTAAQVDRPQVTWTTATSPTTIESVNALGRASMTYAPVTGGGRALWHMIFDGATNGTVTYPALPPEAVFNSWRPSSGHFLPLLAFCDTSDLTAGLLRVDWANNCVVATSDPIDDGELLDAFLIARQPVPASFPAPNATVTSRVTASFRNENVILKTER